MRWQQSPCHPLHTTHRAPEANSTERCGNQSTLGVTQPVITSTVWLRLTETPAFVLDRTTEAREQLGYPGREMQTSYRHQRELGDSGE